MTLPTPSAARGLTGSRRMISLTRSTRSGFWCATATRSMRPSKSITSMVHQSAR
jgi:hypothetical protein